MATDFWASSHYKRWIVDRATLKQARADDLLYVVEPEHLGFFNIYFANLISKLGKKLQLRQRVIATSIVFFRRFYLKNSYCETDPYLVLAACCYVAAKAEESPVHIKNVVTESRTLFSQEGYPKNFPSDNSKLAEMEFYLVDDLECDLIVFHPYRTLLALCKKESSGDEAEAEAGELGTGIGAEDGPRYWGTGQGRLVLSEGALQTAWFIINDTYRSELCLLYPPHLIAITAIYLTLILHGPTQNSIAHLLSSSFSSDVSVDSSESSGGGGNTNNVTPRRSTRQSLDVASSLPRKSPSQPQIQQQQPDPIAFLADLNVSLSVISTISQEILSLYSLWSRYKEEPGAVPGPGIEHPPQQQRFPSPYGTLSPAMTKRSHAAATGTMHSGSGSGTPDSRNGGVIGGGLMEDLFGDGSFGSGSPSSSSQQGFGAGGAGTVSTPGAGTNQPEWRFGYGGTITPLFLSLLLKRMKEAKLSDVMHPASGRPVAVNKMLERTQAAG